MNNKGEILASVLKKFKECYFFLHNTREFDIVEIIMNEGFVFENQLTQSADPVNPNDPVEVTYFLIHRKDYGSYTIIIAIPKITYESYKSASNKNSTGIEEVLSITNPVYGDNDELIYTLSPRHILGYFNTRTSEFYQNRNWDPFFKK